MAVNLTLVGTLALDGVYAAARSARRRREAFLRDFADRLRRTR